MRKLYLTSDARVESTAAAKAPVEFTGVSCRPLRLRSGQALKGLISPHIRYPALTCGANECRRLGD